MTEVKLDTRSIVLMVVATVGFGFLQGARFIDPGTGPYSQSSFALFGLLVDGCTFLVVALLSFYAKMESLKPLFILGSIATAIYLIADLTGVGGATVKAIAGAGWSLNILCWMHVFTQFKPRAALIMITVSYPIMVILKPLQILLIDANMFYPIFYLLSIVMLFVCLKNACYIREVNRHIDLEPKTTIKEAFSRTRRAVVGAAVISFVCGFTIQSDALVTGLEYAQTALTAYICLFCGLAMLVVLIVFKIKKANIDYIFPVAALVIATILCVRCFGIDQYFAGSMMTSVLISFYVLLWLMFVSEAHERTLPAFFLLGLALAVARLSVCFGRTTVLFLDPVIDLSQPLIPVVVIWFLVVAISLTYFFYIRYASKLAARAYDLSGGLDEEEDAPELLPAEIATDLVIKSAGLSDREGDVIRDFATGRSARYIADWYMISEHTVKTHLRRAYKKLDVHSRQELLDKIEEAEASLRK